MALLWISASVAFGLETHHRAVCVGSGCVLDICLPIQGASDCHYEESIYYSLAGWSIPPIMLGAVLISLGLSLMIFPRLRKEMREDIR